MRRRLVESDGLECVLGLGPGLFYNSPMEACVVICRFLKRIQYEARGSLGPDEIRIAVTAYEAALKLIGGAAGDDGVRDTLASYIIQNVLDGGRDEVAVRESAIGALTGMKRRA